MNGIKTISIVFGLFLIAIKLKLFTTATDANGNDSTKSIASH